MVRLMYFIRNNIRRAGKFLGLISSTDYWPALRNRIYPAIEHEIIFRNHKFDTIIDVGANVGQFAIVASVFNSQSKIYSFEPINSCFEQIERIKQSYRNIYPMNFGLGSENSETEINLSGSLGSSSFLEISDAQERIFPGTKKVGVQIATIKKLDDIFPELSTQGLVLLKVDVQGFELEVLKGSERALEQIDYVYLEGSFVELYRHQPLVGDLIYHLGLYNFNLCGVFNVDTGSASLPAQADFLFQRNHT